MPFSLQINTLLALRFLIIYLACSLRAAVRWLCRANMLRRNENMKKEKG